MYYYYFFFSIFCKRHCEEILLNVTSYVVSLYYSVLSRLNLKAITILSDKGQFCHLVNDVVRTYMCTHQWKTCMSDKIPDWYENNCVKKIQLMQFRVFKLFSGSVLSLIEFDSKANPWSVIEIIRSPQRLFSMLTSLTAQSLIVY